LDGDIVLTIQNLRKILWPLHQLALSQNLPMKFQNEPTNRKKRKKKNNQILDHPFYALNEQCIIPA
jgi:hypothetical protein